MPILASALLVAMALSPIATHAMPFQPMDGGMQLGRRRAIDYPQQWQLRGENDLRRAKRSVGYSVVQVDGGSSTTAPVAPSATAILLSTVTTPANTPAPETQTLVLTSTAAGPSSPQTILVTTTQQVQETVTAAASSRPAATSSSLTSSASSTTSTVAQEPSTTAVTSTVMDLVTSTVAATQATNFYDDGLWHTWYPVKTFLPPGYSVTGSSQGTLSASSAAAASSDPAFYGSGTKSVSSVSSYDAGATWQSTAPCCSETASWDEWTATYTSTTDTWADKYSTPTSAATTNSWASAYNSPTSASTTDTWASAYSTPTSASKTDTWASAYSTPASSSSWSASPYSNSSSLFRL